VDTRSKILRGSFPVPPSGGWPEFARPLAVVTGYFDVLRGEHAREFERVRETAGAATVLAIVLPSPGELLPPRARAELVAALRAVDYVAVADGADVEGLVASIHPAHVVRLEEADQRRLRELREHVRLRTHGLKGGR